MPFSASTDWAGTAVTVEKLTGNGRIQQRIQSPEVAARITDHMNHLQQIVIDIRSAIYDLSPDPAGAATLRTSLHTVITELTADAPLSTTVRMSGQLDRVPPLVAQHAEAVLREAVSNGVRHSRPDEFTITVGDDLVIDVADDGVGIPDTHPQRAGRHADPRRARRRDVHHHARCRRRGHPCDLDGATAITTSSIGSVSSRTTRVGEGVGPARRCGSVG